MAIKSGRSVRELQSSINSADFSELIAYNNIEPFMIDRSEYMIANLCALTANINSPKKSYKPEDFMIRGNQKKQSSVSMEKTMEAIYGSNK